MRAQNPVRGRTLPTARRFSTRTRLGDDGRWSRFRKRGGRHRRGRDQDLALLESTFRSCIEDSVARALLVVAPPGMGKSRLRHEFLRRLKARHGPVRVILGRGDPLLVGSPYSLLRYAVRQLCGILERDDAATQHSKLWQHVSRRLPESEVRRVVEFIGRPRDTPFYVQVNYTAPHWPWEGRGDADVAARLRRDYETKATPVPIGAAMRKRPEISRPTRGSPIVVNGVPSTRQCVRESSRYSS